MTVTDVMRPDYKRRLLYHLRVVDRLATLDWSLVDENLQKVAAAVRGDLAADAMNQWGLLVAARDEEGIARVLREDSEHADLMRVVSPFAGVLSDEERQSVIRHVRSGVG